ncbi:MAG: class I SAM-dependent RNA methyltransferase [Clostridia bacterium]|nr:class I SAM-dependent RNA methyltransferase [Clostridia bacterium]
MKFIATTGYSLEGVLNRELKSLGMNVLDVSTSRVMFEGDHEDGCRASLMLRSAGRILLQVASFEAMNFDELFDGTYSVQWERIIEEGVSATVVARSVNSSLFSQKTIQSIVQKAVFKRICDKRRIRYVNGEPKYHIDVLIHKNIVSISIDLVGAPLHKRGYRVLNPEAALRETLAASLVLLSGWKFDRPLHDPFCGSGTILIEAALLARNIGPGMNRKFFYQDIPWWPNASCKTAKERCKDEEYRGELPPITGGDIDERALLMAVTHIKKAKVAGDVQVRTEKAKNMQLVGDRGHIITNPPYGERMANKDMLHTMYSEFAQACRRYPGYSCHIITSYEQTQPIFGRKADKKRKLYNSNLETIYYQFFGSLPRQQEK